MRQSLLLLAGLALVVVPGAFGQKPHVPGAVICNQYDNVGANGTNSQDFETALDSSDDEAADDCSLAAPAVIGGVGVQGAYFSGSGPAASVNVRFYANSGGLPGGTLECARLAQPYNTPSANFEVDFGAADCSLAAGVHWVSVQARQDFSTGGQWGWTDRTVQTGNGAAWRNPGGALGVPNCTAAWGRRGTAAGSGGCGIDVGFPDQVFRLYDAAGPAGPPPCDSFADAAPACQLPTTSRATKTGATAGATGEPGEPNHGGFAPPRQSVWYHLTPTRPLIVYLHTCTGTSFDSVLSVYTGSSVGSLIQLAANDDGCGVADGGSRVQFLGVPGTTYHVALDGGNGAASQGAYQVSFTPLPRK